MVLRIFSLHDGTHRILAMCELLVMSVVSSSPTRDHTQALCIRSAVS